MSRWKMGSERPKGTPLKNLRAGSHWPEAQLAAIHATRMMKPKRNARKKGFKSEICGRGSGELTVTSGPMTTKARRLNRRAVCAFKSRAAAARTAENVQRSAWAAIDLEKRRVNPTSWNQ